MSNHRIIKILIIFSLAIGYWLLAIGYASALTDEEKIAQLKAQIDQLEQQAQQYKTNIAKTEAESQTLKTQINSLKNQIVVLQNQIAITNKNIDKTKIEINGVQNNISDTQDQISYKKDTIGRVILSLNQNNQDSLLTVLMKNSTLADYFRQRQDAVSLSASLLGIVSDLKNTESQLEGQQKNLEGKKSDLESLNKQQTYQKISLDQATQNKNQILIQTKGQEAQYQKMLIDVQNQESAFFSQLRELETRIIQGGLYIVHVTAGTLPKKGTKLFQWPETGYRVTQGYGCTKYARCGSKRGPYNGSPHNGIDMAAGFGSQIHAMADGTIIANGKNDGWGNWVAIQHPNQYNLVSIYAHMSALSFLQVGTQIKSGDVIGYEGNTGNAEGSHLHLSIYKDFFTYVNASKDQLYFNYFEGTVNPLDYL